MGDIYNILDFNYICFMKKLLFVLFVFSFSLCEGQSWDWGAQGIDAIKAPSVATWVVADNHGNAYLTGQYATTIIFGNDTLSTPYENAYFIKYNSTGSVIWAKQPLVHARNSVSNQGTSDAIDSAGNIYFVGAFSDTAIFDTYTLSDSNYTDLFIAKYNSSGNVLWAKQSIHSGYGVTPAAVTTDITSNTEYITGAFYDTVAFGVDTLIATEYSNVFLVKYDGNGNVVWAKQSSGKGPSNMGTTAGSVAIDKSGNIYVTGSFYDTIAFSTDTLFSANEGMFLVKYDANGGILWAIESDTAGTPQAVVTDNSGNIYIAGYSYRGIFLSKYDYTGTMLWLKFSGSTDYWKATSLSSDGNNHIYLAGVGFSSDTLKLGNNYFTWNYYSDFDLPAFLLKLDTAGNPLCGTILPGGRSPTGSEWASCASDSSGTYIYLAGSFDDSLICGPDTLYFGNDESEPYIARWNSCNSEEGITPISNPPSITLFPNPSTGIFTFQSSVLSNQLSVEVYNVFGERVFKETLRSAQGDNLIKLTNQPSGVYLYRVLDESGALVGEGKFVIQK